MRPSQQRFVACCQQLFTLGVLAAVIAPAASVAPLDVAAPDRSAPTHTFPVRAAAAHVAAATSDDEALVAGAASVPVVHEYAVRGVDAASAARLSARDAVAPAPGGRALHDVRTLAALTPARPVEGTGTVGVTWSPRAAVAADAIEISVRTRLERAWGPWFAVPYDPEHGPDPGSPEARHARPGTDEVIVGDVHDVQLRVVTADGSLPADLSLAVVDPGVTRRPHLAPPALDTAALDTAALDGADPMTARVVSADGQSRVTPMPTIYSRAQWGADESLRDRSSLHYFEVHAGFVHHTVNTNSYSRDEVPSLLRGIYAYHTQSRGWSDIGYNFVIDRFGRVWEGRFGGVARPVVGAHTLDYNEYSFAASALGNFEETRPSRKMVRAYSRLYAWKLALHGVAADDTRQRVGDRVIPAIDGHRDVGQTACPGRYLYARIPKIRARAAALQVAWGARDRHGDLVGTSWPDVVVRDAHGRALALPTQGQVGFTNRRTVGPATRDGGAATAFTSLGDVTGDGRSDVLVRGASGTSVVRPASASGGFGDPVSVTDRFARLDQVVGVGDLDGDGRNDVVGRTADGHRLLLFRGRGSARFASPVGLQGEWGYRRTAAAGDLDRDGHVDLLARGRRGALWFVPGTGGRVLGTPVELQGSWRRFDLVSGGADLTGDRVPDLVVRRRADAQLLVYPGNGGGGFDHWLGPFGGFGGLDDLDDTAPMGQAGAGRLVSLVGVVDGRLVRISHNGRRNVSAPVPMRADLSGARRVMNVGDWNRDGRGDVMVRRADGTLALRTGKDGGRLGGATVVRSGWRHVSMLTPVGDMTGDGNPDLLAQPRGGPLRLYPGNGERGLRRGYAAHSALSGQGLVGVGLANADGAPDAVLRTRDGHLSLWAGNGPGGLVAGRTVASGADVYDAVIGPGDVDGDGRPDLVARQASTGWLWLLPGTKQGFGERRFLAQAPQGWSLIG